MFSIAEATLGSHLILDVGFVEKLELWGYPVLHVGDADSAVVIVGTESSLGDDGIIIGHGREVIHDSIVTFLLQQCCDGSQRMQQYYH